VLALVFGCQSSVAERAEDLALRRQVGVGLQESDSAFAVLIERLSEPGGYFDTDNLISNETSYLHVLGALEKLDLDGGAYIGVGPDQNFSYIATLRPSIAFVIDIRRDNMLQHFMFKAFFEHARNRIEYLAALVGRPVPNNVDEWGDRSITDLVAYIDQQPATDASIAAADQIVQSAVEDFGVALSDDDRATITRFHHSFMRAGLDLRFTSHNRGPQPYYPTYRQLLLERDLSGEYGNYLVDENRFQVLKRLEAQNLVVPVVGDLGGSHALRAVGEYLREQGETLSVFYTSNVEFYLMGQGSFDEFAANVASLPYSDQSVIIRSYFGGRFRGRHPLSVPGYFSTQLMQSIPTFVEQGNSGGFFSYYDLVTEHALPLR
jgi:hypothetical protein